jgi:hypothetical protein
MTPGTLRVRPDEVLDEAAVAIAVVIQLDVTRRA